MAGIQPHWQKILFATILLALFWYIFFSSRPPALKAPINVIITTEQPAPLNRPIKVQVEVYYEVLCPDSRHFVMDQVLTTWRKLHSIMDVHWKPYGKASHKINENEVSGYSFNCQHGPTECIGNMIHACAIKYVQDQHKIIEYIACMISNNREPQTIAKSCAEQHGINWAPILACAETKEGGQLLAMHGDDSVSLRMTFIPTVQIDGSQNQQSLILRDLHQVVCKAYKGPQKPESCDML